MGDRRKEKKSEMSDAAVEGEEVPIYLRVRIGDGGCSWYVIKANSDKSEDCEPVPPVFAREPNCRRMGACVALGSVIYSLGGEEDPPGYVPRFPGPNLVRCNPLSDVYYIDTASPESGWKKLPHSMITPRPYSYAFTTNGKIYVLGGTGYIRSKPTLMPEVYDTLNDDDEGWRFLADPKNVPLSKIGGHGVIDGGKRVVVHFRYEPHLYCYDVEADSWEIHRENTCRLDSGASATVDGVYYFLDRREPGVMFGIEVGTNVSKMGPPKRVALAWEPKDYEWIPQPYDSPALLPRTCLLSVGKGRLAAVYNYPNIDTGDLHFHCSTMQMTRLTNACSGETVFMANPLCCSNVVVEGLIMEACIAVLPSQTRGPQEGVGKCDITTSAPKDVRKEDSTSSALEDVSMKKNTISDPADAITALEDVIMEESTIPSSKYVTKEYNSTGGSDINDKRRKLGENVVE